MLAFLAFSVFLVVAERVLDTKQWQRLFISSYIMGRSCIKHRLVVARATWFIKKVAQSSDYEVDIGLVY